VSQKSAGPQKREKKEPKGDFKDNGKGKKGGNRRSLMLSRGWGEKKEKSENRTPMKQGKGGKKTFSSPTP